jgi:hypothetical protein
MVVASPGEDSPLTWAIVANELKRVVAAVNETGGFEVSAEHQMFTDPPKIDVLPRLIVKVHDTVKLWAADLLSRVQEFVGYHLARYVKGKKFQGVKVRPFTRMEMELLLSELKRERDLRAGGTGEKAIE